MMETRQDLIEKYTEFMTTNDRISLYLVKKDTGGYEVINWTGDVRIHVSRWSYGKHNIAGTRIDVWFFFAGRFWHGVQYGENTQLVHCKKMKIQTRKVRVLN